MRVRMLTSVAGLNWSATPGDVIELRPDEAKRFIKAGLAEKIEKATVEASENAMRPKARARKGVKGEGE